MLDMLSDIGLPTVVVVTKIDKLKRSQVEARVKEETKATIRVIPDAEFRSPVAPTTCMVTGEPAKHEVIWARAY